MAVSTSRLMTVRDSLTPREWRRVGGMGAFILLLHIVGFGILGFLVVPNHYHVSGGLFGFGTGILAYTLGLRHAFDADHIAAIDNSTRKLMADGKRPLSVGFFFSLGHSTVVFILSMLLGFGIKALEGQVSNDSSSLHHYTGLVGTSVSGFFLYLIAGLNVIILVSIVRVFLNMRQGRYNDEELERQLDSRGLMNRFFGPLARRVDTPWKMYPIGVLFGLGFDTATEIALLVLAGGAMASGLPFYAILCLPILFAAGMCLLDTTDGSFMNFAYGWAFSRPIRKVYYNLTITGLSVAVALFIGTIELLGILGSELNLSGGVWDLTANFNINRAGFFIVGIFVVTWIVALSIWHFGNIEARWEQSATVARERRQRELEMEPG
jgi:high-affinity nickel-transport protein